MQVCDHLEIFCYSEICFYLQLQEMRGNIRVFCRARKDDRAENCLKFLNDQDLVVNNPQSGKKMFSFDKAFDPNTSQEQVRTILGFFKNFG